LDENKIIPYVEPVFRFCCKRVSNRHDAEDLASEIICHVLDGMNKYKIESLDAWVWRVAHNRYARFIDAKNKNPITLSDENELFDVADYSDVDEDDTEEQYETVFRYLHTMSSEYKNIFVDYYIGEMSIRELAQKYSLPETTIKWRLNAGRQKIRDRIGENKMDKVYTRINWNTTGCNGSMDPDQYLHTQISRAICLAAYEKPLTVEEISISTGIPTMYIEDELPRLEYGDAICKVGNKYVTNFIIFRLKDRKQTEDITKSLIDMLSDQMESALKDVSDKVKTFGFYGCDFGIDRLGYVIVPYLLRRRIQEVQYNRLKLERGPYPPRKDGGYGWFIVEETADENENTAEYDSGCNIVKGNDEILQSRIYYYWINKYLSREVYRDGIYWMCKTGISQKMKNGIISKDDISDFDAARYISLNLLSKAEDGYKLNFSYFTREQFAAFTNLTSIENEKVNDLLAEWILSVRKSFEIFVPKHLHDQINQWLTGYLTQIVGYVTDELIRRGTLKKPDPELPLTDCIFCVEGDTIDNI